MNLKARINKLEGTLLKEGQFGNARWRLFAPEQVDTDLLRELLKQQVSNAVTRKEIVFTGDPNTATEAALLAALGYSADEQGLREFGDEQRVWLAVRKHALGLPHLWVD